MKAVKIIGVIVGGLILLWLIASAVMAPHCHIERSTYIHAPVQGVFDNVNTIKNWEKWSFWMHVDTTIKITYNDIPSGKGSSYSWDGQKIKTGKLTITESTPPSNLQIELEFGGNPGGHAEWKFEPSDTGGVKVTESFDKDLKFTERVPSLMMNKMLGEAFEKDLAALKEESKNAPATPPQAIEQVDVPAQWVVAMRDTTKMADISNSFHTSYTAIATYLQGKKVAIAGPAVAVWYQADPTPDVFEFEAGFPIKDSIAAGKGMRVFKLGGGKAVKTIHMGDYKNIPATYTAMNEYVKQNNLAAKTPSWEVYITDPMSEKDTTKWQTEIYYPL